MALVLTSVLRVLGVDLAQLDAAPPLALVIVAAVFWKPAISAIESEKRTS